MKIISKHRDYYDIGLSVGIDELHILKRETEKFEYKHNEVSLGQIEYVSGQYRSVKNSTEKEKYFHPFLVGFCNKVYIGWKISWTKQEPNTLTSTEVEIITYDKNDIVKILKNEYKTKKLNSYLKTLDNFYNSINNKSFYSFFKDHHVPYFLMKIDGGSWYKRGLYVEKLITYPVLSDIEFYKAVDPFTAFQEIDMFYFGVLGNKEADLEDIEEKYRMTSRGYDKTSFRQAAPGDKKEKRKANKLRKRLKRKNI